MEHILIALCIFCVFLGITNFTLILVTLVILWNTFVLPRKRFLARDGSLPPRPESEVKADPIPKTCLVRVEGQQITFYTGTEEIPDSVENQAHFAITYQGICPDDLAQERDFSLN